ncbi:hypothetical protein [Streptomyces sp. HM190]|uniref:hypothetical protein n=1 Tax=Streptomyces sp. HM190 TaxID=2695266 RepID=UPI00135CCC17|nr:hypothetical protein [Streptomyces sp. HM190]
MDQDRLKELVTSAALAGVCQGSLVDRLQEIDESESGEVRRSDLLHTYKRRLGRVGVNTKLHDETASLVSFLENYPEEVLSMISIKFRGDGFELFLADRDTDKILHWMQMFSRPSSL